MNKKNSYWPQTPVYVTDYLVLKWFSTCSYIFKAYNMAFYLKLQQ